MMRDKAYLVSTLHNKFYPLSILTKKRLFSHENGRFFL
jgi:hypothetical protein